MMTIFRVICLVALVVFQSCAWNSSPKVIYPKVRHHKVVAYDSDNKKVDASKKYIHRVLVRKESLPNYVQDLPFSFVPIEDSSGRIRGLMVREKVQIFVDSVMGLTKGDILTSVDRTPVASIRELRQLVDTIRYKGKSTVTIERKGEPHKLFYVLAN